MRGLAQLPFERQEPLALLGLGDPSRLEVDPDYYGYGWARIAHVALESPGSGLVVIANALVLALHTPDPDPNTPTQQEPNAALELEFWVDHNGEEVAVQVSWERFAEVHVSPLLRADEDLVLALCNPDALTVCRPVGLRGPMHYADGDVTAWSDSFASGPDQIRLQAPRWRTSTAMASP